MILYLNFVQECYDIFVVNKDFTNGQCIKRTLSKTIGYVIMVAAAILKVILFFKREDTYI